MRFPSPVRSLVLLLLLAGLAGYLWAQHDQHPAQPPAQQQASPQKHQAEPPKEHPAAQNEQEASGPGAELAEASREAAGEEGTEFKQSASVRWLASVTGLQPLTAYWVFVCLNFAIIALLLVLLLKSRLPAMFRARTESIQKGMEEARRASEEARRRLADIESRLARLDSEIAAMSATAEVETGKEEARIQAAAEEEKRKIIEAAEQEIAAATKQARTQLRAYVAELAVGLAEKRIQIEPATDQELVRAFLEELGRNGR